jgi:hypothetical protein
VNEYENDENINSNNPRLPASTKSTGAKKPPRSASTVSTTSSSARATISSVFTRTKTIIKTTTTNLKLKKNEIEEIFYTSPTIAGGRKDEEFEDPDELAANADEYEYNNGVVTTARVKNNQDEELDEEENNELHELLSNMCLTESENEDDEAAVAAVLGPAVASNSDFENTDEIETKRFERSGSKRRSSNRFSVKRPATTKSALGSLRTATTSSSGASNTNTTDEDEYFADEKSKFKVIKEFERTVDFVRNASNLKVMNLNEAAAAAAALKNDDSQQNSYKQQESGYENLINANFIVDSLCYNNNMMKSSSSSQKINSLQQGGVEMQDKPQKRLLSSSLSESSFDDSQEATCQYRNFGGKENNDEVRKAANSYESRFTTCLEAQKYNDDLTIGMLLNFEKF